MSPRDRVKELGEKIGYGNMMQLASDLWREYLSTMGLAGGEFTVGPCRQMMVECKHTIKDDNGHCELCCGTGLIVQYVNHRLGS